MLTTIQEVFTNLGNAYNSNKCSQAWRMLTQPQQVLTSRENADTTTGRVNKHGDSECSQMQHAVMHMPGGCWQLQHSQVLRIVSTRMLTIKPADMHGEISYGGCSCMYFLIMISLCILSVIVLSHYGNDNRKAEPHAQRRSQHLINTQQN